MRNRWLRPILAAAILFVVVVFIVIGCSMKKRASNVSANTSTGKSTPQTVSPKHRSERRRASVHDSTKPCDAASVVSRQGENPTLQTVTPNITRIVVTVETERQSDPAFRLFQPPAQAGSRRPDSGWLHFRPQAGQ